VAPKKPWETSIRKSVTLFSWYHLKPASHSFEWLFCKLHSGSRSGLADVVWCSLLTRERKSSTIVQFHEICCITTCFVNGTTRRRQGGTSQGNSSNFNPSLPHLPLLFVSSANSQRECATNISYLRSGSAIRRLAWSRKIRSPRSRLSCAWRRPNRKGNIKIWSPPFFCVLSESFFFAKVCPEHQLREGEGREKGWWEMLEMLKLIVSLILLFLAGLCLVVGIVWAACVDSDQNKFTLMMYNLGDRLVDLSPLTQTESAPWFVWPLS